MKTVYINLSVLSGMRFITETAEEGKKIADEINRRRTERPEPLPRSEFSQHPQQITTYEEFFS